MDCNTHHCPGLRQNVLQLRPSTVFTWTQVNALPGCYIYNHYWVGPFLEHGALTFISFRDLKLNDYISVTVHLSSRTRTGVKFWDLWIPLRNVFQSY